MLESLFNKVAGWKAYNFIKKRLQHRCFPVNIAKIFKNTYLEKHLQMTAFVNSRSAIFQESLVLPFKLNALTSGNSWQHMHSNLVGIFLQF